jgi:hypothetical protein
MTKCLRCGYETPFAFCLACEAVITVMSADEQAAERAAVLEEYTDMIQGEMEAEWADAPTDVA